MNRWKQMATDARRDARGPAIDSIRTEGQPIPSHPLGGARQFGHVYGEAFALMLYATADGSEHEWIWNSRDGITPFCVASRTGKLMNHVHWHRDRYVPDYEPKPGERIFVTLTRETARTYATALVERHWDDDGAGGFPPMSKRYESKEAAIDLIAADSLKQFGGAPPDILEIGAEGWTRG